MAQLCETMMLILFGLSWPFNILKSYRSRTAAGKSILFEGFVVSGFAFGLAGKFLSGNITYVVAVYLLDIAMVSADLVLTLRNKRLDRLAEKGRA